MNATTVEKCDILRGTADSHCRQKGNLRKPKNLVTKVLIEHTKLHTVMMTVQNRNHSNLEKHLWPQSIQKCPPKQPSGI